MLLKKLVATGNRNSTLCLSHMKVVECIPNCNSDAYTASLLVTTGEMVSHVCRLKHTQPDTHANTQTLMRTHKDTHAIAQTQACMCATGNTLAKQFAKHVAASNDSTTE